ncbi:GMP synthase [Acrasis kona]|uniref:GMP synthase [glutamine-hydrolyzing] n=1 Tax=Acrasis kona TaxID=1008807 RepID=A0AAW2Z283_9EUKA
MSIVILNFGSQFAHLIARRVRELSVHSEIVPYDMKLDVMLEKFPNVRGIILSGGPESTHQPDAPFPDKSYFEASTVSGRTLPILGICYGMQLIATHIGAHVGRLDAPSDQEITDHLKGMEYGKAELTFAQHGDGGRLLKGLCSKPNEVVWMSHGDSVSKLPEKAVITSTTTSCHVASFEIASEDKYAVQFHPEVAHTISGSTIMSNFVFDICKCEKDWSIQDLAKDLVNSLREEVGPSECVIMGVSGGVDSTVASTLLIEALGPERVHCVFVDHGLLRKNERQQVIQYFEHDLKFSNFHLCDASDLFLSRLKGVTDPEEKRKIIGHSFIESFDKEVENILTKHKDIQIAWLGQGTIYPDRIESAQPSKSAHKIKSHHNLTLPASMKLKVVEPLKELYKDEVRRLGLQIGVPKDLIDRHPFPGPGLAIRILGEIDHEKVKILQESDYLFIQELRNWKLYDQVWQAFAALIPVRTVGVMGDARTYDFIITLRAVTSVDGMTADWAKLPYEFLEHISTQIINRVKGVNRVLYDVSQKPPSTIEYE